MSREHETTLILPIHYTDFPADKLVLELGAEPSPVQEPHLKFTISAAFSQYEVLILTCCLNNG